MQRLEVGQVAKAHGLKGEVIVRLTTNRPERMQPGARLFVGERALTVQFAATHQDRWRVRFEGVTDRTGAEALHGKVLTADPIEDPEALWVHELIGKQVIDADPGPAGASVGVARGVIVEVQAQPSGDLALLDTGHLVPLRFVTSTTGDAVTIEAPAGLFDLLD